VQRWSAANRFIERRGHASAKKVVRLATAWRSGAAHVGAHVGAVFNHLLSSHLLIIHQT
jgi:hypothetical protein